MGTSLDDMSEGGGSDLAKLMKEMVYAEQFSHRMNFANNFDFKANNFTTTRHNAILAGCLPALLHTTFSS